jgi:hypothetical protein
MCEFLIIFVVSAANGQNATQSMKTCGRADKCIPAVGVVVQILCAYMPYARGFINAFKRMFAEQSAF